MSKNGISTMPKGQRKAAKLALAQQKRQQTGTNGYRELNKLANTVAPAQGRPWTK